MTSGNIILLNGAAGDDKTSIVQALQAVLDAPYLNMGVDKLVSMLPDGYLERPLRDKGLDCTTQAGLLDRPDPYSPQLISGMHHTIAALARAGNHVIATHMLSEPGWLRECAQLFCELPTLFVGIRCSLEILEAREQASSNRPFGSAYFGAVHIPGIYDVEVDTSLLSPMECALQIKHRIQEGTPPIAMRWLKAWSDPAKHRGWLRRRASYNSIEEFATRRATP
jgi:chloramphenicol 3-O phosphotransferase